VGRSNPKTADWNQLRSLVERYAEASRADEMKGGGDPEEYEIIEKELELARMKLELHISRMQERYGDT